MTIKKILFNLLFLIVIVFVATHLYFSMYKPFVYGRQFQQTVIDPTLAKLGLYSKSASNLLLGTAMQESCIGRRSSNIFQIDMPTAVDVNANYLAFRPKLNQSVAQLYNPQQSLSWNINNNVPYQVALARIVYLRHNKLIPDAADSAALAQYWKDNYNTYLGKGTAAQYQTIYNHYFLMGYWRCVIGRQF